jgi:signal transduction histidine kinase
MRRPDVGVFLHQMGNLPLSWLSLSRSKRLLLVAFSYLLGIVGLLYFFLQSHNGATMFLPIICACWLFRYRGLLISLVLNGIAFQLSYTFFWQGLLPNQAFVQGGITGFGTSLGLGLLVCWLRITVDQVYVSRQQTLAAEQAHLLTLLKESQTRLAYEQQRQINDLKDQFLLNVSHELRTPLTVLGGYLELLEEHDERLDTVKRLHMLKEALKSKEDLSSLIDRMLDAAKVANDTPLAKSKSVNVYTLLRGMLQHLTPLHAQSYTILLDIPEQIVVWADPQFLRQVVNNLLSNIFKYVPPQTEIHIKAEQADPRSTVRLSVQDAGPGIPAEELPLLFEKFVRLQRDMTSSIRGTGLGLYISKQLVEAMGGKMWVESPGYGGVGSCFYIDLPAATPQMLSASLLQKQQSGG